MILNGRNSPWKNKNLTDLFKIVTGSTPSTKSETFWKDGNVLWVTPTDLSGLGNNVFIRNSERKITNQALSHSNLTLLPIDSIILSTRAPVGYVAINKKELCFNQGCKALVIKDEDKTDSLFYYYYFLFIRNYLESISGGSTFKELSKDSLKNLSVPFPEIAEQTDIANILSTVDEAIQKADEAITKTERIKQAMMQKLLSEGIGHKEFKQTKIGKIPKTWTIKKFSEFVEAAMGGGTPSTKIESHWTGDIHWMTSANIDGKEVFKGQKMINADAVKNSATNLIPKDSLLVATRVGIGKACINRVDMAISQDLTGFVLNNQIKLEFLYWFLMANQTKLKSLAQGSTIKGILKSDLLKMDIPLPDIKEQIEISDLLDNLLNLLELKLSRKRQLEKIKQGLMDDLLTGKKRVKIN